MEKSNFEVRQSESTKLEGGVFKKLRRVLRAGAIVGAVGMSQMPAPAQAQYLDPALDDTTSWSQSHSSYDNTYTHSYSDYSTPEYSDTSSWKAPGSYVETEQDTEQQKKIASTLKESAEAIQEILLGKQSETLLVQDPAKYIQGMSHLANSLPDRDTLNSLSPEQREALSTSVTDILNWIKKSDLIKDDLFLPTPKE